VRRITTTLFAAFFAVAALCAGGIAAETYPTRPVRVIVPFPAGQATDVLARIVSQSLAQKFGVGFPVDNRGGAGGVIGMEAAAHSDADGYTLLVSPSGPLAINPWLYSKLPYDSVKSFAPISLLGMIPLVLVVHPSVQAHSVEELVKLAKASPGKINFASSGAGSAQHLAAELFKWRTKIDIVHVPYKGSAPAATDLIAGNVQMMIDTVASALPAIQAGRVRALAVTIKNRSSVLPNVPTMIEAGLKDFEAAGWAAMLAPAGTPPDIVNRVSAEVRTILDRPDIQKRIVALGMEPASTTPEGLAAFHKQQLANWKQAVDLAGIKPH
jgi:tripartite-type tricarboxylate transporter receptor subunit TctC